MLRTQISENKEDQGDREGKALLNRGEIHKGVRARPLPARW
jgi:hypothetical protein